jgi:hypothetical protein
MLELKKKEKEIEGSLKSFFNEKTIESTMKVFSNTPRLGRTKPPPISLKRKKIQRCTTKAPIQISHHISKMLSV